MIKKLNSFLLVILIVLIIVLFVFSSTCLASGEINTSGIVPKDTNEFDSLGKIIIGMVQWGGSAVAAITIVIIGIKYMISSIEERAEYKQTFTYYVIGCIIIFSAVNILSWIYNIFND